MAQFYGYTDFIDDTVKPCDMALVIGTISNVKTDVFKIIHAIGSNRGFL